MRQGSKVGLVVTLILISSACASQATGESGTRPYPAQSATASILPTAGASLAPNPSITNLHMLDRQNGWAWTSAGRLLRTTPKLAAAEVVSVAVDASIPTPTLNPTQTFEPAPTQDISYEAQVNATRLRFAPGGTWMEISDTLAADTTKRFVLAAGQGQVMSVSIPQGPAFTVDVTGADKKVLSDTQNPQPFWRGGLPSSQDYFFSVRSQAGGPFQLRLVINPPGQATQDFWFFDSQIPAGIQYSDEFAPTDLVVPVHLKGSAQITLAFIDPDFYAPRTNLSEAYAVLADSDDPAVVASCTQPPTEVPETVTGQVPVNRYSFIRSEFSGAAAGNRYDQVAYRTVWKNHCIELVFLIHSTNIDNYPPGAVVEYDHATLMNKFEAILDSFVAK